MWSVERGGFLRVSHSASLALLWLAFFFGGPLAPLIAQSTTSAPQQPDMKPWSNADTVSSLSEALSLIDSTLETLDEVRNEAENSRQQAEELSAELTKERQDSEERERLSQESLTRLEKLIQVGNDRAALDQKAINEARAQRMAWAGGGFLVGAGLAVVTALLLH